MKNYLTTQIRHGLTFLAGSITFLAEKGLLTSDEATSAAVQFEGVTDLIAPLISVFVVRVVMQAAGQVPWLSFLKSVSQTAEKSSSVMLVMCALTAAGLCVTLPSCSSVNYQVDGGGLDWDSMPIRVLNSERVTPLVDVPLPEEVGGGVLTVPVSITPTK